MSAHSPGPWQVHPLFQTDVFSAEGMVAQTPTSSARRFEDARLIAAAPELLEELKLAAEVLQGTVSHEAWKRWRALIRRADGASAG